ncbi:MAG: type 3 dihydrofolate reductase [Enterovibrio sp.]
MKISMIAAMAHNRIIGNNNRLPWHLPADFAWFKRHTLNKPILMGKNTFDSIGHALPKRRNLVLSSKANWHAPDVEVVTSLEQALGKISDEPELMIIGGEMVYQQFLPLASTLYLTFVDAELAGDTYFPDHGPGWKSVFEQNVTADPYNQYDMQFTILERLCH